MITAFNESKSFMKHISCKCRCKMYLKTRIINFTVNVRNHWNYTYAKEIIYGMLEQVLVSVNI